MAVFILEDALSFQMDNASMAVFIIIGLDRCGQIFVLRLVMRLKYKDRHKMHYASG